MNSWNPSQNEITNWAYEPCAAWPDEDWDMTVATRENAFLILQLADKAVPQADFFVHCLYVLVGSFAAIGPEFISDEEIERLLTKAADNESADLQRWRKRSRVFLSNPDSFDRASWVDGGWALDDEIWRADESKPIN